MTYRGDSPSKKLARVHHWFRVKELLEERFYKEKHLVLASEEGGDISTLLGFGVSPENIVAVDHDPEVIWNLPDKFPSVKGVYGDVFEVAKDMGRQLGSAFLDFCGQPNPDVLAKVAQLAAHGMKDESVLSVGFMRGREKGQAMDMLAEERWAAVENLQKVLNLPHQPLCIFMQSVLDKIRDRDEARTLARSLSKPGTSTLDEQLVRKYLSEDMMSESESSMTMRGWALSKRLVDEGLKVRCYLGAESSIFYTSATEESRGTPMQVLICQCSRLKPGERTSEMMAYTASQANLRILIIDAKDAEAKVKEVAQTLALDKGNFSKESARLILNMTEEEIESALVRDGAEPSRRRRTSVPTPENVQEIRRRREERKVFVWANGQEREITTVRSRFAR